MSMLESAAPSGRPIHFIHAAQHGGVHAFQARVQAIASQHRNVKAVYVYDQPRKADRPDAVGFVTQDLLASHLPAGADVDLYLLGPKPFMKSVYASGLALGIPSPQLRYEFFGPLESLTA
ncbi:MAG: hypothetical protein RLZZ618_661 [Pseudomonadota bacterium]|jgi:nitric oxide dioxygenase